MILTLLPYSFAKSHQIVAWYDNDLLYVTLSDNTPQYALWSVVQQYGAYTQDSIVILNETDFLALLQTHYEHQHNQQSNQSTGLNNMTQDAVDAAGQESDLNRLMEDIPEVQDLLDSAADAPIIRLINALLTQAVREGASDIHIEPFESSTVVRLRVDGTLRDIAHPKRSLHAALISRIKIMANLDIAERRLPQDGRMGVKIATRPIDVRVSTLPVGGTTASTAGTGGSERAVLRLLDKTDSRLNLDALGMNADTQSAIDRLIKQPYGIVLVTGPTGSGKTTTLYSAIKRLDASTTNILTVEDPIEYELSGIGQTQVNAKIDLSFATALRAILRQDPDVVMIGEIRDVETASIAVQASLTGHLVLATLHTNDAIGAITRLIDMGVEPFLLSSSLIGVVAQRLVRKLCQSCKIIDDSFEEANPYKRYKSVGCAVCNHTGYSGRVGIYELLSIDSELAHSIHQTMSEADLKALAQSKGLKTLREDAQRLIEQGLTSLAEVERVTRLS